MHVEFDKFEQTTPDRWNSAIIAERRPDDDVASVRSARHHRVRLERRHARRPRSKTLHT